MRIVFMGTGEIAIPALRWLIEEAKPDFELVGVFTQPDKKVGRKQLLTPPEVKLIAESKGIPVFQPERFRNNSETLSQLQSLNCDIAVVMAYGQILPDEVISAPRIACVNLHASLLPRHRGASPIQAAIREGDAESGITLMHIATALDAGEMILKKAIPIHDNDTGGSLHDRLAVIGPDLLREGLPLLASGKASREEQDDSLVTVSRKLHRADGEIDWAKPATEIERQIRAFDPWPGTYSFFPNHEIPAKKFKIFPENITDSSTSEPAGTVVSLCEGITVSCGGGTSLILKGSFQAEGRKRLSVPDFLRGVSIKPGMRLGKKIELL